MRPTRRRWLALKEAIRRMYCHEILWIIAKQEKRIRALTRIIESEAEDAQTLNKQKDK